MSTILISLCVLNSVMASKIQVAGQSDDPLMMPYYTGDIIPTPQKAEYTKQFISLKNAGVILGKDVEKTDARLQYLLDRITRYGGTYDFVAADNRTNACLIFVGDTPEAAGWSAPARPQGYAIKTVGNKVFLKGHDHQGLLWAISSLNQMILIRDGAPLLQAVNVEDWPATLKRGMLASGNLVDPGMKKISHLMVTFKFNLVDFRKGLSVDTNSLRASSDWRLKRSELFHERIQQVGKQFKALGFQWYAGDRFLTWSADTQINIADGADFDIIYNNYAEPIAAAGGGLSVQFDDARFPLHAADVKKFGAAVEADTYFMLRLYDKLKAKYPDARIAFCPPFYFGPDSKAAYPEPREKYLQTIGEKFPKAIDIYWTGPRVKGTKIGPEQVAWIAGLIKRPPFIFQNGTGIPHIHGYHYATDPIFNLKNWYYDGFLNDVGPYLLNGGGTQNGAVLVSIADWTWNPKAFQPEACVKDAVCKLTGPESYDLLCKINQLSSRFDPYYADKLNPGAVKHAELLFKTADELEQVLPELDKTTHAPSSYWLILSGVGPIRSFVNKLRKADSDPSLKEFALRAEESRQQAAAESNINPDTDIFLSACDFTGGKGPSIYKYNNGEIDIKKRLCACLYGAQSAFPKMTAGFEVSPFPPSGPYQLLVSAVDDDHQDQCPIKIDVNGNTIFEGPNPFDKRGWNLKTFTIPADALKRNNTLTIANMSPTANFGVPPFILVNYVVVRKTEK
ncbi:MAG: beta-N-acetylglucosaminidase domain-containing protein [Kiritimatiellae bacterium]|nr:beta-N-acetylglucosaminidase domain-containing protein [Kiritimatiellia bacterium]